MADNMALGDAAVPPTLHPSTAAALERYPTGTLVRARTNLHPGAPHIIGEIPGYIFTKDPATGKAVAGEAMLATADGTVFVPVAAIQGPINPHPPRWERWVVWLVLALALVVVWYSTRTRGRA